jgi:hypothetical protein
MITIRPSAVSIEVSLIALCCVNCVLPSLSLSASDAGSGRNVNGADMSKVTSPASQRATAEDAALATADAAPWSTALEDAGPVVTSPCHGVADAAVCDDAGVMYLSSPDGMSDQQQTCGSHDLCRAGLSLRRCPTCVAGNHACAGSTGSIGGTGAMNAGDSMANGAAGASCPSIGAATSGLCKATANGVYAMKVDVDVWYMDEINNTPLFDPGRGKLTIYSKNTLSKFCDDGSEGTAIAHPCGTLLPGLYASTISGVIQIVFPEAKAWDAFPDYKTTGRTTGFDPGATLTIDKTTVLLGIDLATIDQTWPTYMETPSFKCSNGMMGDACFSDVDMDKHPGLTVSIMGSAVAPSPGYGSGWKYVPAPTSLTAALSGLGATKAYIGLRTKVGGSGAIGADCKSGAGRADADDFQWRVQGCVRSDRTDCNSMDATFVDQNMPVFHALKLGATPPANWMTGADASISKAASIGPQSNVVRLGDVGQTFSCADVQAAFPK